MLKLTMLRSVLIALCSAALSGHAVAEERKQINVPAGDLIAALKMLSQQSEADVVYRSEQLQGVQTRGVAGELSVEEAVNKLLEGTNLTLRIDSSGAILIALPQTGVLNTSRAESPWEETVTVEEVIVTAQKREERLRDAAVAVSAIRGDKLDELGLAGFADYIGFVPGLTAQGQSAPGQGQTIIRGLTTGASTLAPTVAYYVDDTPFSGNGALAVAATITPDPDLIDVDHIEVLRGPQGTLYGANSLGGLIKIVTKAPDLSALSGNVRVDGVAADGGELGYGVRGTINVPISAEKFAVRLTAFDRQDPGYIDNPTTGGKDVNSAHVYGGRAALLWQATDALSVRLNYFEQRMTADGSNSIPVGAMTLQPVAGDLDFPAVVDTAYDSSYTLLNGVVKYDFEDFAVMSSSNYSEMTNAVLQDLTPGYGPLVQGLLGSPGYGVVGRQIPITYKFTQELRFTSTRAGNVEYVAGGYYTSESSSLSGQYTTLLFPDRTLAPAPLDNFLTYRIPSEFEEYSVFGDVTYYIVPQFDVTAGARWFRNEQNFSNSSSGFVGGGSNANASKDQSWSYLFTARWRPVDELNLYARVATGYRPGGPQPTVQASSATVPTSYEPDTVTNYEIGAKGRWLNGRLSTDATVYFIDWDDIVLNARIGPTSVILQNAGNARSKGVELEAQFAPLAGLLLGGHIAINRTEILSLAPNTTLGGVVGDELPYAPKLTGSLLADYQFALSAALDASIGASYRYVDSSWSNFPGAATNTGVEMPSYELVDLRTALQFGQASRYELRFSLNNVTDKRAITSVQNSAVFQPIPSIATIVQPRTYRLTFTAKY